MGPRLNENLKALKVLRQTIDSGEIGPDDYARTVQALGPLFLEYMPETFRTLLNRLNE